MQSGFSVTSIARHGRKMPFQVPSTQFHLPAAMEMCGVSPHCTEAGSGEWGAGSASRKKLQVRRFKNNNNHNNNDSRFKTQKGPFLKKVFDQEEIKKKTEIW